MRKFELYVAVGYVCFVFGIAFADIGEIAKCVPEMFTLWDAIWIPTVITIFPMFIGYSVKK